MACHAARAAANLFAPALAAGVAAILGSGAVESVFVRSSHAQQPNPSFQLAFCNLSTFDNVRVALAYQQNTQRWVVDGWYPLPDRGCTLLGSFLRDTVYYYAENDRGAKWPADGANLPVVAQCIDHNKTFRVTASMPSCPADQEAAKFRLLKIPPNQPRLTWTLTGGK